MRIISVLLIAFIVGCSSSPTDDPTEEFSLSLPQDIILTPNNPRLLSLTKHFEDGSSEAVGDETNWSSSDGEIVEVSSLGEVTALTIGEAVISAVHRGKTAQTKIEVIAGGDLGLVVIGNTLRVRWQDTLEDELGYEIQKKNSDNSEDETESNWIVIKDRGPVSRGLNIEDTIDDLTGEYRVVVLLPDNRQTLVATANGNLTVTYDKILIDAVQLDVPENKTPYTDTVSFTLSQSAIEASWKVDGQDACTNNECTPEGLALDTNNYSDGKHLIEMLAEITDDVFVHQSFQIEIYNPFLSLDFSVVYQNGQHLVLPNISSKSNISEVSYALNGEVLATQSEKTEFAYRLCLIESSCHKDYEIINYDYHYVLENVYGEQIISVTAKDQDGEIQESVKTLVINAPPLITITNPLKDHLVTEGTLVISGSIENEDENISTEFMFGDVQIGTILGTGEFSVEYELNGLSENVYQISVLSTDGYGSKSSKRLDFEYVANLGITSIYTIPSGYEALEINDYYLLMVNADYTSFLIQNLQLPLSAPRKIDLEIDTSSEQVLYPSTNNNGGVVYYVESETNSRLILDNGENNVNLFSLLEESPETIKGISFNKNVIVASISYDKKLLWNTKDFTWELVEGIQDTGQKGNFSYSDNWICRIIGYGTDSRVEAHEIGSGVMPISVANDPNQQYRCQGIDDNLLMYTARFYEEYVGNFWETTETQLYSYDLSTQESRLVSSSLHEPTGVYAPVVGYSDGVVAWKEKGLVTKIATLFEESADSYNDSYLEKTKHGFVTLKYHGPDSARDALFLWDSERGLRRVWHTSDTRHYIAPQQLFIISGSQIFEVR